LLALRVLERVERAGAYADLSLHAALGRSGLNAPDRAFATELVYGTLRWRGRLDFALRSFLDRDFERLEPLVASALRLGAYQLLLNDRVPDTAAVDQSVRCIRAAGVDRAAGFVNAVLRRLAANPDEVTYPTLEEDPVAHLRDALSLPGWLAERWIERYGPEEAAALARASNDPPPLTIRANSQRTSQAELLEEIRARFPDAHKCKVARDGIVLARRGNPTHDPAFLAGRFTVQDEASQLVVGLLDPRPGERVLDVCAAPGGKTTAIAERVGPTGAAFAVDRHPRRLALVRRAARRLGLAPVHCIERDATQSLVDLAPEGGFDRVLVDAPCSGLGTLRRNPDARWRVRPNDPARLANIQVALLRSAARVVRPGGTLVYSVCTILPEENEEIVEAFLKSGDDFTLAEGPSEVRLRIGGDGFLRCFPHQHDADGFFAARFERR
jgi:16S rRNA (cytosine967-C5)-methyltransferase